MFTTTIVVTIALMLFVILPFVVEIRNASEALVISRDKSIIAAKPLTLTEMKRVKEYAVLFGLDNETVTDSRILLAMGHLATECIGEDTVQEIVSGGPIKPTFKLVFKHARINFIIKLTQLVDKQSTFTLLVSRLMGGSLDEEAAFSI